MNKCDGNIPIFWDYRVEGYYIDRMGREQYFREELDNVQISEIPHHIAQILSKPKERRWPKAIESHGLIVVGSEFKKFLPDTIKIVRNKGAGHGLTDGDVRTKE